MRNRPQNKYEGAGESEGDDDEEAAASVSVEGSLAQLNGVMGGLPSDRAILDQVNIHRLLTCIG